MSDDLKDRIAEAINAHRLLNGRCEACGVLAKWESRHQAEAVVAALQPEITTAEQLAALPHQSLVMRHYVSAAGWKLHEVWERRSESWYCLAAPLNPPGREFGVPSLPVRLLWHPSWVGVLGEEQR